MPITHPSKPDLASMIREFAEDFFKLPDVSVELQWFDEDQSEWHIHDHKGRFVARVDYIGLGADADCSVARFDLFETNDDGDTWFRFFQERLPTTSRFE